MMKGFIIIDIVNNYTSNTIYYCILIIKKISRLVGGGNTSLVV